MTKRVLVTGGRGFIGRRCLAPLTEAGFEVHGTTRANVSSPDDGVSWHQLDLLDSHAVANLVTEIEPSHLLHLAWVTEHGVYWQSPLNQSWLTASQSLLTTFAETGGHRAVVASSCVEYDWSAGTCQENVTPLNGASPYSRSKIALTEFVSDLRDRTGLQTASGRVFFSFGEGAPATRLIPSVVRQLNAGESAKCSDGVHRRDFIYVQDVANAFAKLLSSDAMGPVNIGSGEATSIRDVVTTLARLMGREDLLEIGARPTAQPEPPLVVADVARLHEEVNFSPHYSLEMGLNATIQSLTTQESFRV